MTGIYLLDVNFSNSPSIFIYIKPQTHKLIDGFSVTQSANYYKEHTYEKNLPHKKCSAFSHSSTSLAYLPT